MVMQVCPISGESRNEHVVRVVAALVALITIAAITLGSTWAQLILILLACDFAIRGFARPVYSPLAVLGRITVNSIGLAPKPVDWAPKRFAARIGVLFSAISAALFASGAAYAGNAVAGVLVVCAFLEAAFAFCVGCRLYALLPSRVSQVLAR